MRCIAYLTEIEKDEYDSLAADTKTAPEKRSAQTRLAQWMTTLIHGEEGLATAVRASEILFGGEIGEATDASLGSIFADVPSNQVDRAELDGDGYWIVDALQATGLVKSGGEARRAIKEGGVYVNNIRATDEKKRLTPSDLASETVMVFRRGKRKYSLLKFI
jgi:tyrosyl-tRNA synthetase